MTLIAENAVTAELEAMVAAVRADVDRIAESVRAGLTAAEERRGAVRADLVDVEGLVRAALGDTPGLVHGGGFVSAPDSLADAPWWLEWFAWDGAGRVQRLLTDTDPEGAHFFDYTLMPWYADPARDGLARVTGPYVDYLCTDDYTLTFTVPVLDAGGAFRGVAGADVRLISVERRLLGPLRATDRRLVVVNALGRIVTSNSPSMLSGDLIEEDLRDLLTGSDPRRHAVTGSELAVLDLGPRG